MPALRAAFAPPQHQAVGDLRGDRRGVAELMNETFLQVTTARQQDVEAGPLNVQPAPAQLVNFDQRLGKGTKDAVPRR